jgi:hypothetical protein
MPAAAGAFGTTLAGVDSENRLLTPESGASFMMTWLLAGHRTKALRVVASCCVCTGENILPPLSETADGGAGGCPPGWVIEK